MLAREKDSKGSPRNSIWWRALATVKRLVVKAQHAQTRESLSLPRKVACRALGGRALKNFPDREYLCA